MKTIKIKFEGFWPDFVKEDYEFYRTLARHYDVQVTEDADYVFFSIFSDRPFKFCNYPGIRILVIGENYLPDFNLVDYAISPYPLQLQDRSFYFPFCIDKLGHCEALATKNRDYSADILKEKVFFANMIASHDSEFNERSRMFHLLSEYKRVESPGSFLHNADTSEKITWLNSSKTDFQRKCKFTLCLESTKHEGFVTEKITDAFFADTIPIYYGSSSVKEIFNEKAFIDLSDYPSFEDAVNRIIEIDNDDDLYLAMLRQPIFVDNDFVKKTYAAQEQFLLNIFDQPLEKAKRRSGIYTPKEAEDFLTWASFQFPVYIREQEKARKKNEHIRRIKKTKTGRRLFRIKKIGIVGLLKKIKNSVQRKG